MAKILAYCGLDCGECEAYIATQKNDRVELEAVAKNWSARYGGKDMGADVCVSRRLLDRGTDEHGPTRRRVAYVSAPRPAAS